MDWVSHDSNKDKLLNVYNNGLSPEEISGMKADAMRRVKHMQEQAKNTLNHINFQNYLSTEPEKTVEKVITANNVDIITEEKNIFNIINKSPEQNISQDKVQNNNNNNASNSSTNINNIANNNSNCISSLNNLKIDLDKDKTLILALLAILLSDNCDQYLILALIYILF
jgi:hypothetical protein